MPDDPMTNGRGRPLRAEPRRSAARCASSIGIRSGVRGHARRSAGLASALFLALAGCGYRPLGTEALPANVQTVAIGPIGNTTYRPGLQGFLAEYLHQRILSDGRVRLRPSSEADAVIETVITSYGNEGVAWDPTGVARRFRVQINAGVALRDRRSRLLINEGMVGEAYYTAGTGVGTTLAAEEDATRRALRDLADRVAARIIEGL